MPRGEKAERVGELKSRIEGSDALLLTEYRGLTVSDITSLRRSLAEGGTRFSVIKNTLMRRAAADASIAEIEPLLEGPTAVAFVSGDPVSAAKRVVEAAKRFPTLVLKGGYMDGHVLSADEAKALADLESREAMLSKVAGMLKSEMSRAAAVMVSAQSKFLSLLESYKEKVPGGAVEDRAVPGASVESDSEPTSDEAPAPVLSEDGGSSGESSDGADAPGADTSGDDTEETHEEE